jgi:gliding motility-associated protein GldM
MAGYKETPRQKMIGMMYLVLTALLALNVSKEIMDAFLVVNESMETTNENFSKKLDNTYAKFQSTFMMNEEKVGPYWNRAKRARDLSNQLTQYIDSIKYVIVMRTDGLENLDSAKTRKLRQAKKKDNYDTPTRFFMAGTPDGSKGEGKILRDKIEGYKKAMLELVDEKYRATIKMGIETDAKYYNRDGKEQNWQTHNFYHTILAATVTILNQIKADVKNIEFDVVNSVFSAVTAEDYKFDVIKAKVIPRSQFVFTGDSYDAEIIVAAYETKGKPVVKVITGADTILPGNESAARSIDGENGIVNLTIPASGEGLQKFAGFMQVLDPNGQPKKYYFSEQYTVMRKTVSISPTQMLVFYKGVPNPLKVSIPGGGSAPKVDISYGTVTPTDSGYIVNIPALLTGGPSRATVTVSATYEGKQLVLGSESFRLKSIPEPDLNIASISGINANKNVIIGNPNIYALRPAGFDLSASYSVLSYKFITQGSEGQMVEIAGTGKILTQEMVNHIKKARRGQVIVLTDIKVKAPDGERKLQKTLTYQLN